MYYFIYNEKTSKEFNIEVTKRPFISAPQATYDKKEIPGGKTLHIFKRYEDIEISVEINFIVEPWKFQNKIRELKRWLMPGKELQFSDNPGFFYKVNEVSFDSCDRIYKKLGKMAIKFTCEPYSYVADGKNIVDLKDMYNEYEESRPIYSISGEGLCAITRNGKTVKVNVGGNVTLDTEKGLCYKSDGNANTSVQGVYEDLYLNKGNNTFTVTDGFTVEIQPNWRCL